MKKVIVALLIAISCLAFSGGAIYQYYQDKPIIENQKSLLINYRALRDVLIQEYELLKIQYVKINRSLIESQTLEALVAKDHTALQVRYDSFFDYSANVQDVSVEQAVIWLERAAYSHEHNLFDDDPSDDEFHQGCIDRYASIKALLLKMNGERIIYIDRPVEIIKEIEVVKEIKTTIYRYPNTPPYEAFSDPIDFDQAMVLLHGMRASHVQCLNWEFESDPGFGIADKDLQKQFIKWYDQLIDIFWRMKKGL